MAGRRSTSSAPSDPEGPGEKSAYHHGNLREALVEAAVRIVEAEGLEAMGLRCAARAAGVSAAAPYHHFGSKEGLLAAVAAEGFRRLARTQHQAAGGPTGALAPRERINALGRAYVRFARQHPELYRLMFGRGIENRDQYPELGEAIESSYAQIASATEDYLAAHSESGLLPRVALNGAWCVVHGMAMLLIDGKVNPGEFGNPEEDELIETVLEIWARGVDRGLADWKPSSES